MRIPINLDLHTTTTSSNAPGFAFTICINPKGPNPPWPRCECGHRRAKHFERGMPRSCKWHRVDKKTKKMMVCDCTEYWVLEEKLRGSN